MRSARRNLGTQLLMLLVVLTGLYFGYNFAGQVVQAQRLAAQAAASRADNDQMAADNRKLQRDLQYYQSDAYAELRARTDLNMRQKDEQIILPVLTPAAAAADPAAPAPAAPSADPAGAAPGALQPAPPRPATGRTWDQWIALFTAPAH